MSKIQTLFACAFVITISLIVSGFVYTEEIRDIISNKYYIIISFLILYLITNIYSPEIRDRNRNENDVHKDSGMKYLSNLSISLFTVAGIVIIIHIFLFIVQWIKSNFS